MHFFTYNLLSLVF